MGRLSRRGLRRLGGSLGFGLLLFGLLPGKIGSLVFGVRAGASLLDGSLLSGRILFFVAWDF